MYSKLASKLMFKKFLKSIDYTKHENALLIKQITELAQIRVKKRLSDSHKQKSMRKKEKLSTAYLECQRDNRFSLQVKHSSCLSRFFTAIVGSEKLNAYKWLFPMERMDFIIQRLCKLHIGYTLVPYYANIYVINHGEFQIIRGDESSLRFDQLIKAINICSCYRSPISFVIERSQFDDFCIKFEKLFSIGKNFLFVHDRIFDACDKIAKLTPRQ